MLLHTAPYICWETLWWELCCCTYVVIPSSLSRIAFQYLSKSLRIHCHSLKAKRGKDLSCMMAIHLYLGMFLWVTFIERQTKCDGAVVLLEPFLSADSTIWPASLTPTKHPHKAVNPIWLFLPIHEASASFSSISVCLCTFVSVTWVLSHVREKRESGEGEVTRGGKVTKEAEGK